jgi:hypothetical protein
MYCIYIPKLCQHTDNVNILCKYLTYILADYSLILTKDIPDLSSERAVPSGTALARTSSRPVLSSDRALQNNKPQLSKRKSQGERKIGRGSQMGA